MYKRRAESDAQSICAKQTKIEDLVGHGVISDTHGGFDHRRHMQASSSLRPGTSLAATAAQYSYSPTANISEQHKRVKIEEVSDIDDILGSFKAPTKSLERLPAVAQPNPRCSRRIYGKEVSASGRQSARTEIDLTKDSDTATPSSPSQTVSHMLQQTPSQQQKPIHNRVSPVSTNRRSSKSEELELIDEQPVPAELVSQAKTIYQYHNRIMPADTRTWKQLKTFVQQNPVDKLTLQQVQLVQANLLRARTTRVSPVHGERGMQTIAHGQDGGCIQRSFSNSIVDAEEEQVHDLHDHTSSHGTLIQKGTDHEQAIDTSLQPLSSPSISARDASPPLSSSALEAKTKKDPEISVSSPDLTIATATTTTTTTTTPYLNHIPDLLPPTPNPHHPHLIDIRSKPLLRLPLTQHSHLTLPDVICSILHVYDRTGTDDTLRAFLDPDAAAHFFFLFRARSERLQSWSVEREGEVITIGIERPNRPARPDASTSPSAGHYDLHLRYRLGRPVSTALPLARPWHPTATAFFPAIPSLYDFLHHTHPNRGAESHIRFSFDCDRAGSGSLSPRHTRPRGWRGDSPSDPLFRECCGLVARYMQQTALTTAVVAAEVQCVFGRKVRYDAGLGRVRLNWDYAIRGAETVRRRRRERAGRGVKGERGGEVDEGLGSELENEVEDEDGDEKMVLQRARVEESRNSDGIVKVLEID